MSGLRRTGISRKTELARGNNPLRRKTEMKRVAAAKRTVAKQKRQRDTGPSQTTKRMLWDRARGHCELCGRDLQTGYPFSRHHRRPRGMGGSSMAWVNDVTNLLLVCGTATTPDGCHARIETHRAEAYDAGWLIRYGSEYLPAELPVLLYLPGGLGVMQHVEEVEPDGFARLRYELPPDDMNHRLVYLTPWGRYADGVL